MECVFVWVTKENKDVQVPRYMDICSSLCVPLTTFEPISEKCVLELHRFCENLQPGERQSIAEYRQSMTGSSYPLSDTGESVLGRDIIHIAAMRNAYVGTLV